ncbi:serine/threonine-protein kinase EDR1 isoform X1 [Primulina eburnea]|uniref:serine/threonine-protein kinase EDR1 isoform X1 n=1 Tax=Primulina eburnea TaxID=1245227 RepID=UPI003C6C0335
MKHIFKKLHHQPNRSNETPQPLPPQSPTSSSSDSRATTSSSSNAPTTAAVAVGSSASHDSSGDTNRPQQDYYSSEEEYQVQLALALSASSSGQVSAFREKALIRSVGAADSAISAAEMLSRRYWNYGVLDFEEKVVDGFYDLYNVSTDSAARGNMPSLTDLENSDGGYDYEVVLVSRKLDPALEELMQISQCIMLDCRTTEIGLLIQRLAELVTEHLGGPVPDANLILSKWMERSIELRTSLHTTVLPIGSLQVGLSRHRALLFKVLCDSVGIPCRLVKGSHYTGFEDDAVNIVKLQDDSECLVDLMGAPGTLIPVDVSAKDTPLNSFNPQQSKLPILHTNKIGKVSSQKPDQNSNGGNHWSSGAVSVEPEALHKIYDTSVDNRAGFSGLDEKFPCAKSMDHISSQVNGSSFVKGSSGTKPAGDGSKMKLNVVPYSPKSSEASKNLFADLNPFQVKGSDKSMTKNNLANGFDRLQLPNNNIENSRLPAPMRNNLNAQSEVSKRNEFSIVEGIFLGTQGHDNNNMPSIISRSANVQSKAFKVSEKSFDSDTDEDALPMSSNGLKFANAETKISPLRFGEASNLVNKETYYGENVKDSLSEEPGAKDHRDNFTRPQDESMQHRLTESSKKLRETEVAGRSVDLSAKYVATVIDDVGECEILWENLVIGERIGLGSYGEVYHAEWNDTEVAVKKFLDQDFSGAALDEFKREVRIMRRLRHPNIVLFMGAVTRPPNLSIVSEFLPRGSLFRIIHRPHCQIDEERRIKMALDVAKGMNCLHTSTPTIVHRDLKSHNLLVDNNWNVKVCDFGLSRLKHNTFLSSKSTAGTPEWMAPEILRNEPSNEKCDVYSFGVILWELATLKLPWNEMNPIQVVGAVGFQNRRLEIPKEVDPLVTRIICECWQTEPNLRPSFAQLSVGLKHLQRLVVPSHVEHHPTAALPQQNTLNST